MGDNTKIEWADKTFNPWVGCTKVSAGCAHCYAETFDHRFGGGHWGKGAPRKRTSPSNWRKPLAWDRQAAKDGTRPRVFCASLADVFDPEVDIEWLYELLMLIGRCRHLIWLLLTKRPELIRQRISAVVEYMEANDIVAYDMVSLWICGQVPEHVWIGTSVEDQAAADERIPHLLRIPAAKRFLSCEPLLGPVDIRRLPELRLPDPDAPPGPRCPPLRLNALTGDHWLPSGRDRMGLRGARIDWVIAGGESGPKARPMHPEWARSLRDQCQAAGVPYFFKQWGEWAPGECANHAMTRTEQVADWLDCHDVGRWDFGHVTPSAQEALHVEEEPLLYRMGKKRAGRLLDGRTWDEVPAC